MPTLETLFSKLAIVKVIDESIPYSQYIPIDLSTSNSELSKIDLKNANDLETYIENYLRKNNAKVAFGGYYEVRNLYKKNTLFNDAKSEERDIHIGMDLWTKSGTPVLAALNGKIFGFDNNTGVGNYGPTIILQHSFENQLFYTLYGHLSLESINNVEINTPIYKGQRLGTLGDSSVNGGYSPHLHFQIIKNIDKNRSDYPGVCSKKDIEYYLENCPNPNLLLKIQ